MSGKRGARLRKSRIMGVKLVKEGLLLLSPQSLMLRLNMNRN